MARSTLSETAVSGDSRHRVRISGNRSIAVNLFLSLRPSQWSKNLLVFAALIFAVKLFDIRALTLSALGFTIFCGLSGAVYLFNDVMDRENDRRHPFKSLRPIASGHLAVPVALAAAALLASIALAGAFAVGWR